MCSGDFSGSDDGQCDVPAAHVAKCRLTMEKESRTFLAETTMGVSGGDVTAVTSENLPDVPSPTTVVTNSRALFVKNTLVHISPSALSPGAAGKVATGPSLISAARPTQRVP